MAITKDDVKVAIVTGIAISIATLVVMAYRKTQEGVQKSYG